MVKPMVVAIDGPAGSGKSTASRAVGERLVLPHLDTGAFYRAATATVIRAGVEPTNAREATEAVAGRSLSYRGGHMLVDGQDVCTEVRSPEVTAAVSAVSAHPDIRALMVSQQRAWVAERGGGAVVEGRDIGTVVFPDADLKIYLTASPEVRASRRGRDAEAAKTDKADLVRAITERDAADSSRSVSPLRPAEDAIEIDTSHMSIARVVDMIVELAEQLS